MAPIRKRNNPYTGPFCQSEEFCRGMIASRAGFHSTTSPTKLMKWGVGFNLVADVYKCRDLLGRLLGHVVRSPEKKMKTYKIDPDSGIYSFYNNGFLNSPIVIVEDCISAMAVASHGYDSVALLGTNLTNRLKDELKATGRRLLVMLDPDAISKALDLAFYQLPDAQVATGHTKDPKDMPALGEFLESYL